MKHVLSMERDRMFAKKRRNAAVKFKTTNYNVVREQLSFT